MSSFKDLLGALKRDFLLEHGRIKAKIAEMEESLEWEEAPTGKSKKEFKMLYSREAKNKTLQTLYNELNNHSMEMEELQRNLQDIMKDEEGMAVKLEREISMFKKHLPVYRFRREILQSIQDFHVTILVADTGSGKSTLIPQFIFGMDETLLTYCAQPRRLAANGLADYTQDCLGLSSKDHTVATDFSSWDTTFDPISSRIVYTTNYGLLYKWRNDKNLTNVDIVVIDEAHERNLATDLLLGIMKEVFMAQTERQKPIKLVIMSATIDPSIFYNFFSNESIRVNSLSIPGKTFPVEMIYDKNPISNDPWDYLPRTIAKIKEILNENESGDILAFLATPAEIDEGVESLEEYFDTLERDIKAFPLHGNVESDSQRALFKKNPSHEQQRVILATKIAETSVTLPDIMFVVDSGRQKEFTYDLVNNIGELSLSKISKTSAVQRAGRAGRVGPGVCYRLYQPTDYEDFHSSQCPEIRCLPLDQSLLSLFYLGFSSPSTFQFIDPPDSAAIKVGIQSLLSLGAITRKESSDQETFELSSMGSKMAKFNIDPRLAHLIVNTVETEKKWIPEVLVICGMVSSGGNVFYRYGNYESADFQKLKFCHPSGDFITMLEAFKRWTYVPFHEQKSWTKRNFISSKAMFSVRKFYNRSIAQINKIFRHQNLADFQNYVFPVVNSYDPLLKLIYKSFKRSTAVFAGHFKTGYVSPVTSQRMVLHPSSSINKLACEYPQFICYDKVMTTTRTSIFHASIVRPEWIEDIESLYTDFVKSSLVEHIDNYPRLGSKLLRSKIMRRIKALSPELDKRIQVNSIEKQVTHFYNVYINLNMGLISTCCHSENKSILVNHINAIIKEAVDSSKAERAVIPIFGTPNNLNVGLNGIANEIIIPGSFLSIKLVMYKLTSHEINKYVGEIKETLNVQNKVNFLNPREVVIMFTTKEDARKSYNLISTQFPSTNPRWNENSHKNENLSIRFYLRLDEPLYHEDELTEFVDKKFGSRIAQFVDVKPITNHQSRRIVSTLIDDEDEIIEEVLLEVYSFLNAYDVADVLYENQRPTSLYRVQHRKWNACLRCSWKIPSRVCKVFKTFITRKLPNCHFKELEHDTIVTFMDKRLRFPINPKIITIFEEISSVLEGTSFSRPFVPLFFDSASHAQKLHEIETLCNVVILQDKYSQEYSLKIYGRAENTHEALEKIDSYLRTMKTVVTDISYGREKGKPGLLLELLKVYGTNMHKLSLKKGIGAVDILCSKGIIRISGDKSAVNEVEEEIADIASKFVESKVMDEENICSICFVAPDKNDSYRLDLCGHLVCLHQCLQMMMVSSEFPLACPRQACPGGGVTVQDMFTAFSIGPDVKKGFITNCLKYFMATNNSKNCPVVNCRGIYKVLEDINPSLDSRVTCNVCNKDICTRCMTEYHHHSTCSEYKNEIKTGVMT